MKYKIEAADLHEALTKFTRLYGRDKSDPNTVKLQCTDLAGLGVRVTVQRLSEIEIARERVQLAKRVAEREARKARTTARASKKAGKA